MKKSEELSRRTFIKQSTLASTALILPVTNIAKMFLPNEVSNTDELHVSIFSKQLQFLDYKGMSEAAKNMGFDGLDLTIRPKGHVLPERVQEDLPKATEAMKSFGLQPKLFSTAVNDANNYTHKTVLETASQLGYQNYRTAWFKYKPVKDILNTVELAAKRLKGLSKLNKKLNITGGYQNHSGNYFGSGIWDLHSTLEKLPVNQMGSQYDIMHATVEGGKNWEVGFMLIKDYINTIVLKDFIWAKKNGKWAVQYMPLGEGMVDFTRFFSLLKEHKIQVPVSIHVEYDLGGAEHGKVPTIEHSEVFKRIKKDLDFARHAYKETQ